MLRVKSTVTMEMPIEEPILRTSENRAVPSVRYFGSSVAKAIDEGLRAIIPKKEDDKPKIDLKKIPKDEYAGLIKDLSGQMDLASANLEFEKAAALRDRIRQLRETFLVA